MTIFDQTESQVSHTLGKLVKYDNKTLAIGPGWTVEELDRTTLSWTTHPMSPLNDSSTSLYGITALSVEKSLFIFHLDSVIEWDGNSWKSLEGLCINRVGTTVVYAGEIYHIGRTYISENGTSAELFRFD